jgi:hypothetical protein
MFQQQTPIDLNTVCQVRALGASPGQEVRENLLGARKDPGGDVAVPSGGMSKKNFLFLILFLGSSVRKRSISGGCTNV